MTEIQYKPQYDLGEFKPEFIDYLARERTKLYLRQVALNDEEMNSRITVPQKIWPTLVFVVMLAGICIALAIVGSS